MPARNSEIRFYLLRFASRNGLMVKEHLSPAWQAGRTCFYCHIQNKEGDRSSTAVSYEGPDNALCMAFLHWNNPELNFLGESQDGDNGG